MSESANNPATVESQAFPNLDPATARGLEELLEKAAPLLHGRRLHNLVDLASLASDGVDMFDDAMVQKLMKGYEEVVSGLWAMGNAKRYASAQVANVPVPGLLGLVRAAGDEDVRRGLHFALTLLAVIGRQIKDEADVD